MRTLCKGVLGRLKRLCGNVIQHGKISALGDGFESGKDLLLRHRRGHAQGNQVVVDAADKG